MVRKIIHAGQKFNRWTATDYIERKRDPKGSLIIYQKFICECGKIKMLRTSSVVHGTSKSCGCLHKDITGLPYDPRIRNIWRQMISRCSNPQHNRYKNYALRGITVCREWIDDYESFEKWALANGYKYPLTIEREDNDKGYYPENCTWIPLSDQAKNRSNSKNKK